MFFRKNSIRPSSKDTTNGIHLDTDRFLYKTFYQLFSSCWLFRRHLEDIYDLCWSPDGQALVSGSVDHSVIIWQLNLGPVSSSGSPPKTLSNGVVGPAARVSNPPYSISQMTDSAATDLAPDLALSSAATVSSGMKSLIMRDHKHYVQGVTWDPTGFYVASLSSDRACRVYRAGTRICLAHVSKAGKQRLFQVK